MWLGAQCSDQWCSMSPPGGIDINGKREIYAIMEELLERRRGILMLTSDYTEAWDEHRIIVMRRGAICRESRVEKRPKPTSCGSDGEMPIAAQPASGVGAAIGGARAMMEAWEIRRLAELHPPLQW